MKGCKDKEDCEYLIGIYCDDLSGSFIVGGTVNIKESWYIQTLICLSFLVSATFGLSILCNKKMRSIDS